MFAVKEKEHLEFLSIRDKYLKNGIPEYTKLVRYFKGKGTPVSYMTLVKWEKKYKKTPKVDDINPDQELSDFTQRMKELSERNPQYANIYARLKGYSDKAKEVSNDITPDEYIRAGLKLRDALRQEFMYSGSCPVCGFTKALCGEPHLDTEPEHKQGGEVATVGVPA